MLTIEAGTDGAAVRNLSATGHSQWGRCDGDALQFAQEVARTWGLVVATHLPHHRVTILMVVPQRRNAPLGGRGCGIDADITGCRSHDDFLAPVTQDISLITGCTLGVVVGLRTSAGVDGTPRAILRNATLCILAIHIVESLLAEITVPIDAEVLVDAFLHQTVIDGTGHRTQRLTTCRSADASRIGIREVTGHAAAYVAASHVAEEHLRGGGIAVVGTGVILHAGEHLLSVVIGIQVTHLLGIAVSEARSRKSLAVIVDDH